MTDAVIPETIFTPTFAVIGCKNNGGTPNTLKQRGQKVINMLQTCTLPTTAGPPSLMAGPLERHAGIVVTVPQARMPIRHMRLPHIQKQKQRLLLRDLSALHIDPGELFLNCQVLPG